MGQKANIRTLFPEADETLPECAETAEYDVQLERRKKAFKLHLIGKSVRDIARELGYSKSQVSLDIHHMLQSYGKVNDCDIQEKMAAALAKIQHVWNETLEAFEKSKSDQTESEATSQQGRSGQGGQQVRTRVKRKQSPGDPRFLSIAISAHNEIAKLQGLLKDSTPAEVEEIPVKFLTGSNPINPLDEV